VRSIRSFLLRRLLGGAALVLAVAGAAAYLIAGRSLEAREALEEVLRSRPNFVDAAAALGLAHYLSGDALGARDIWKTCLQRRPENARVEAYLAMLGRTGT